MVSINDEYSRIRDGATLCWRRWLASPVHARDLGAGPEDQNVALENHTDVSYFSSFLNNIYNIKIQNIKNIQNVPLYKIYKYTDIQNIQNIQIYEIYKYKK